MAASFVLLSISTAILLQHICCGSEDATVEIESGVRIRGSQMTTLNQRNFYAFRGIPYAEAPVRELRFKAPVRKQWKEKFFDATQVGPSCIQHNIPMLKGSMEMVGQEDCLILNVYTHNVDQPLRKVMVFIHGGAFVVGSSDEYGPRKLLDRNVVLVTINYRLGPFGFLSTLDEASPGNYALLDQTEALKWVKRNIAAFGGDPSKVTLFGESAGSVCVVSHVISPASSGLFHRAIAQSGTVLSAWAEQPNPLKWTKLMGEKIGCDRPNTKELIECMRGVSAEEIHKAANEITFGAITLFAPVGDGIFHREFPSKLLRDGVVTNNVPFTLGVTRDEGPLFFLHIYSQSTEFSDEILRKVLVVALNIEPERVTNDVIRAVKKQYFASEDTKNAKRIFAILAKLVADAMFVAGHYETVRLMLKSDMKNLFVYSHDYITDHSIFKLFGLRDYKGAAHADDLFFLFDVPYLFPEDYHRPNDEVENNYLDIWTSFAENGYPMEEKADGVVKWKSSTSDHIRVYHMDKEIKIRNYDPNTDWRLDFWLRKMPASLDNAQKEKEEL